MLNVYVRSDLVSNGKNEFGTDQEKTEYYIIAESDDGQRLRLMSIALRNIEFTDQECIDRLEKLVSKIDKHLEAGGLLDSKYWEETDPCYGSKRYNDLDATGFFYKREKLEDSYKN